MSWIWSIDKMPTSSFQLRPDPCDAPTGVEFASKEGACKEGTTLASATSCTTQCLVGYTPSAASGDT
eukprot:s7783_g2.t1